MASGSVRVKIPRPTPDSGGALGGEGGGDTTDVPGTFITAMPPLAESAMKELQVRAVNPPYSYSRVTYNDRTKEYLYEVIEPQLSKHEKEQVAHLKETLTKIIGGDIASLSSPDKRAYLRGEAEGYFKSRRITLSPLSLERIVYYLLRDFVGYGPVDALILDLEVEDISCDGVDVPLFIFHGKFESVKTNVVFSNEEALNSFIVMLGQRCSKAVSVSSPILDGTTPEGHRDPGDVRAGDHDPRLELHDPAVQGAAVHPRRPRDDGQRERGDGRLLLVRGRAGRVRDHLRRPGLREDQHAQRDLPLHSPDLEDRLDRGHPGSEPAARELDPGGDPGGTGDRGPDGKAAGEVDMFDLVRAALRQRPNYIIVGEVRGKETYTMFQAMATGHTTYSTMHADSVKSMVNRLENPPINTPRILLSALNNVVIQLQTRTEKGVVRRLKQVLEIVGFEPETNELITNTVYEWDPGTDTFVFKGHSFLFDKIMEFKNYSPDEMDAEFQRRTQVIRYLVTHKINDYRQLWQTIAQYYKDPHEVMARIQAAPKPPARGGGPRRGPRPAQVTW